MSNETKKKPVITLRDGSIKATIWKNSGENGVFFTVNFSRTYTDADQNLKDTDGFSGSQLLKVAHLAPKAYDKIAELRESDRQKEAA